MGNLANWKQKDIEISEGGFMQFPDGWHAFIITSATVIISQLDGSDQVQIDLTAMTGTMEGKTKKIWLNIFSENQQVRDIANSQLKQIAEAVGIQDMNDTSELENKGVDIELKTKGKYQNINGVRAQGRNSGSNSVASNTQSTDDFDSPLPDAFK